MFKVFTNSINLKSVLLYLLIKIFNFFNCLKFILKSFKKFNSFISSKLKVNEEYSLLDLINLSNFNLNNSKSLNLFVDTIILNILLKKLDFDKISKNGESNSISILFSNKKSSLFSRLL